MTTMTSPGSVMRRWTARFRGAPTALNHGLRRHRCLKDLLPSILTPIGWFVLAVTVIAALSGGVLGWVELRALALIGAFLLLIGALFVVRRSEVTAELHVHQQRVSIGDLGMGRVLIRSRSRRGVLSQIVELPVGKGVARFFLPGLGSEEVHEELFSVPARRRSVIPVGPVRAVQGDPLGLLRRDKVLTEQVEIFVHPELAGISSGAIGFLKDIEGVTTQNLSSSDVAFHALRDYVSGDDRRAVHWRTTARTGRLIVRQFEETMRVHMLLVLSLNPEDYAAPGDFELAVSSVASIGVAALREERQVTVWTTRGRLRYPSTIGLLDELSRVNLTAAKTLREATTEAVRECRDASVVALVSGGSASVADIRSAEVAIPVDVERFALRTATHDTIRRSVIGRMTVLDIARLSDLGPALRSIR